MRLNKKQSLETLRKIIEQIESDVERISVDEDQYIFENGSKYPTTITVKIWE